LRRRPSWGVCPPYRRSVKLGDADLGPDTSQVRTGPTPAGPDYESVFDRAPGNYLLLDRDLTIFGVTDAYLSATKTVLELAVRDRLDRAGQRLSARDPS
jgi:hypothetical protein